MRASSAGSASGTSRTAFGVTFGAAAPSLGPRQTPISLPVRSGTKTRLPGATRAASSPSTEYVNVRKSGIGRATSMSIERSGTRDKGPGTRDQGLGTRDSGLGTRDSGLGRR